MGDFLYLVWRVIVIAQVLMAYGTAYRMTKAGGDNGVVLFGWMFLFNLAALVPGLGLGLWLWRRSLGEEYNTQLQISQTTQYTNVINCPSCSGEIIGVVNFCPHCGVNVRNFKNEQQILEEKEFKEKYKQLNDLFHDEKIMEDANFIKRLYGKNAYIDFLKGKAKELGFCDSEINLDDID